MAKFVRRCLYSVLFLSLLMTSPVKASADWSWRYKSPSIISNVPGYDENLWCQSAIMQMHEVQNELWPKDVCMMPGDSVSYGLYMSSGGYYIPVVSFGNNGKMYQITDACDINTSCLFLPGTDTLVRKEYISTPYIQSPVIYKGLLSRLTWNGATKTFSFNAASPDYIFRATDGYAWPIGGMGASINGKWLAMEFYQHGIGLLNIETLQMRRISSYSWDYFSYSPRTELAVNNDGTAVALMGYMSGLHLYTIAPDCLVVPTDNEMRTPQSADCPYAPSKGFYIVNNLKYAVHPRFDDGGGLLYFNATLNDGTSWQVIYSAAGYSAKKLDYLAMGDSFSSGEGETDDNFYINGTNDESEKCHTSRRSYPFLVGQSWGLGQDTVKSVACSGAVTNDIVGFDAGYFGQGSRFWGIDSLTLGALQSEALELFIPGRVHQNSFSAPYRPALVTVGIGGNDAGFMDKITDCLGPKACDWAWTESGRERTAVEIKGLFTTLLNTYRKIHLTSPDSKIYAVGYPKIFDESGQCGKYIDFLYDKTEREYITDSILYLNQVIKAATRAAGVGYLDIYDSFGQHVLCGSDNQSAINLIMLGDDLGPFGKLKWFRAIGQESFHPNPVGHELIAASIRAQISGAASDYCGNGGVICPDGSLSPEPPLSLLPSGYHNLGSFKSARLLADTWQTGDSFDRKIELPDNTFAPYSMVTVSLNSDQPQTWQFRTSDSGSLSRWIHLGDGTPEGIYRISINGLGVSQEDINMYQTMRLYIVGAPISENVQEPDDDTPEAEDEPLPDDDSDTDPSDEENDDEEVETEPSQDEIIDDSAAIQADQLTDPVVGSVLSDGDDILDTAEVKGLSVAGKAKTRSQDSPAIPDWVLETPLVLALVLILVRIIWRQVKARRKS